MILKINNLSCFRGYKSLFSNLDFTLSSGEVLVVEGSNGSGKSTLLKILAGLRQADEGEVLWDNVNIQQVERYTAQVNWLSHRNGLNENMTAMENLHHFAAIEKVSQPQYDDLMKKVGLEGSEHSLVRQFSAGMKRRLALTRLLIKQSQLWLLDEPQSALDKAGMSLLNGLISQHAEQGGMVVLSSHHDVHLPSSPMRQLCLGR